MYHLTRYFIIQLWTGMVISWSLVGFKMNEAFFIFQKCVSMCMDRYMDSFNLVTRSYTERLKKESYMQWLSLPFLEKSRAIFHKSIIITSLKNCYSNLNLNWLAVIQIWLTFFAPFLLPSHSLPNLLLNSDSLLTIILLQWKLWNTLIVRITRFSEYNTSPNWIANPLSKVILIRVFYCYLLVMLLNSFILQ